MRKSPPSSFEILSDTVYVVDKNKIKNIRIIGNPDTDKNAKKTKIELLYDGLHYGTFKTDADAAVALDYKDEKDGAYIKLKHELKKRLVNTILFIDTEQAAFTDLEKARFLAKKDWVAIDFLWLRGARRSAVELAEVLFPIAEKFEITFICLDIAKKLATNFALEGNKKKHKFYSDAIEKYSRWLNAETIAEQLHTETMVLGALNKSHKPEIYYIADNALNKLKDYEDVISITFISFRSYIERTKYDGNKDFRKIIEVCERNNALIKAKPFFHKLPIIINLYNIVAAHIMLRQYDEAQGVVNEYLSYLEIGANNWFKGIDIYITLCFHTDRFEKAHALFLNGKAQRNFKNLVAGDQERWTLYSGYFDLFAAMRFLNVNEQERRSLKISRILADMPEASKDKRGMNIPLLILDIMMRMQQGEHNDSKKVEILFSRIENLSKYRQRHLKKENETFRSDVFIALAELLAKYTFQYKKLKTEANALYVRFQEKPYDVLNQPYEVEVINYEKAWLHICNFMHGRYFERV